MNTEQWISVVSEAYETSGLEVSPRAIEILLQEVPKDSVSISQDTKDLINESVQLVTRHFFRKASLGETFGSIVRVEERFGHSLETNYDIASGPFLDVAKTYWTYREELLDLTAQQRDLVLAQVLLQVDADIGSVFFPFPGPALVWVRHRRETQRELLEEYAPEMDVDAFLSNNPLLGTSEGRIAQATFDERVWVRCPNPNCLEFLRVPNTVRRLEVKCPKCKEPFLFPAEELRWLNCLEPHFHPTPEEIRRLEALRQQWTIPDEGFSWLVIGTYWATEQLQRKLYAEGRQTMPGASDREIFRAIISSRAEDRIPLGLDMDEDEIHKAIQAIDSIDDLVSFVLSREKEQVGREPCGADLFGVGSKIEEILSTHSA